MFPVQNTGKHVVFKIVTVNRSRNDSANNSIYCNSISSRGQKEQILPYKTINQRQRKSKQENSTQDLQEIANKSDYEILNNFCVSLNCVPSTSVSPHPWKLKISRHLTSCYKNDFSFVLHAQETLTTFLWIHQAGRWQRQDFCVVPQPYNHECNNKFSPISWPI